MSELQSDSVALGRVVNSHMIEGLPLASRNFTQIVDLSPGVLTGVNNADELGPGGGGLAQIYSGNDGIFVHGARSYDNGYEFDALVCSIENAGAGTDRCFWTTTFVRRMHGWAVGN